MTSPPRTAVASSPPPPPRSRRPWRPFPHSRLSTASPHPDAALIDLGRRFDEARAEWEARRPAYRAASAAIEANIEAWRDRLAVATREGRDNSEETYRQIFAEADPTDEIGRGNSFLEQHVDPLTEAILRAPPPATVAGLAVKARALTFTGKQKIWETDDPREELDLDEKFIRDLMVSVLRLAGVDRFGCALPSTA